MIGSSDVGRTFAIDRITGDRGLPFFCVFRVGVNPNITIFVR
jgi:hypothetical protein